MKSLLSTLLFAVLCARGAEPAPPLSGTPQARAAAAQALGDARDDASVDALERAAGDPDPAVARAAAEALGARGTARAAEALTRLLAAGAAPGPLANGALRCAEARLRANDAARARKLYEACRERVPAPQRDAAERGLAQLDAKPAPPPPPLQEALRAEDALTRLAAVRASVRSADPASLPLLFDLARKEGEEGRAATLALAAMAAPETGAFLYGELRREGAGRAKAIELLAARGDPELALRLCDASLYTDAGSAAAAGAAWRARLRQEELPAALAFVFGTLPEPRRAPLTAALAAAVQQMPDSSRATREIAAQLAKTPPAAQAELLGLLAGLQNEASRDLLAAQAQAADPEARKAAVRTLTKWQSPLALAPLTAFARGDADRGVKILALRGALAVLQRPGVADKPALLRALADLAQAAERDEERRAVCAAAQAAGGPEADALRRRLAETYGLAEAREHLVAAVNAGGPAVGAFQADTGFSGGTVYAVKLEADLSDTSDAAPEAVYQSCRFRNCAYSFDGLKAGQPYTLRLHFAETFHQHAGYRVFDVAANGRTLLSDYDIFAKTGARMKAVTERFEVEADAAGKLTVTFATKRDQALVNGLELLAAGDAPAPAPQAASAPAPGQLRLLLLTGANNHDWPATTAALQRLFAAAPTFFVRTVERPWEMKPADLEGVDVVFSNWNTYGKDKREWTPEMKAAFMDRVKRGCGFFVLHAAGSMFYDWEEFQALTGGAWEKETFHPHRQAFTVRVADPGHPVTRGLSDFETFDEPWQKTGNRNPARRVLLTGVVSKENKGSGEVEPFAWTTELGRGRCFNLVLGHDVQALGNASCQTLILRGAEWAATGDVMAARNRGGASPFH